MIRLDKYRQRGESKARVYDFFRGAIAVTTAATCIGFLGAPFVRLLEKNEEPPEYYAAAEESITTLKHARRELIKYSPGIQYEVSFKPEETEQVLEDIFGEEIKLKRQDQRNLARLDSLITARQEDMKEMKETDPAVIDYFKEQRTTIFATQLILGIIPVFYAGQFGYNRVTRRKEEALKNLKKEARQ